MGFFLELRLFLNDQCQNRRPCSFSSDHNLAYYGLSGRGAIRKLFLRIGRFHRGRFLLEKRFEEIAFSSEDAKVVLHPVFLRSTNLKLIYWLLMLV